MVREICLRGFPIVRVGVIAASAAPFPLHRRTAESFRSSGSFSLVGSSLIIKRCSDFICLSNSDSAKYGRTAGKVSCRR